MGTTPIHKIPYPEPADPVANYPTTGQALATKVEAITVPGAAITNAVTAAAGWSVQSSSCRVAGKLLMFVVNFTRTGAAITPGASGDVSNVAVAQLNPVLLGSTGIAFGGPIVGSTTGRSATYVINVPGAISLVSVSGSASIATNDTMSLVGIAWLA